MRFKISCLSLVLVFAVGSITGKVEGEIKQIRGANPKDAERYVADKDGKFACFDGKKKIPIAWVNDDYCDCEDGSDEPGTSACNNDARQVNDGVCEEECCDGSDEWSGLVRCENRCLELAKRDVEKELQKQETEKVGGAVKAQLVDKAKVLIVEKGIEVEKLEAEKQEAEKKFEENQKKKEELEKVENKIIEENKEKGRVRKLELSKRHIKAAVKLRRDSNEELKEAKGRVMELMKIMRDIEQNRNKEFNDEAVKAAVDGFEEFLRYNYDSKKQLEEYENQQKQENKEEKEKDKDKDEKEEEGKEAKKESNGSVNEQGQEEEEAGDDDFEAVFRQARNTQHDAERTKANFVKLTEILGKLEAEYNRNYHDLVVKGGTGEYVSLIEKYRARDSKKYSQKHTEEHKKLEEECQKADEEMRQIDFEMRAENVAGDINEEDPVAKVLKELEDVRKEHSTINDQVKRLSSDIENLKKTLKAELGPENILIAVEGECVTTNEPIGEYNYEICFLGSATQSSTTSGSRVHLGEFGNISVPESGKMVLKYTGGTHCWNGPERSLSLSVECGVENKLMSVTEPEKCTYHAILLSPIACPYLPSQPQEQQPQEQEQEQEQENQEQENQEQENQEQEYQEQPQHTELPPHKDEL